MLYQLWCSMSMPPPMPMVVDPPHFAPVYLHNNERPQLPSLLSIEYENPAAGGQSSPNSYHSADEISSVDGEAPDSPSRRLSSSSEDMDVDMNASSSSKSSTSSLTASEGSPKALVVPHWMRVKHDKPFENKSFVAKVMRPSQQLQPADFPALDQPEKQQSKNQKGGKKQQKPRKPEEEPLWHLGELMESLLSSDIPQQTTWEDSHLELTATMDTIERLLRSVFKKTGVLNLVSPNELPCRRSLSVAFLDQDEQHLHNLQLADFECQRERNEAICRMMMTIEEQVVRCKNSELQQVIDRQFTRIDLALRLISTILHDSPLSEEASRRDSDRAFRRREQMEIDAIRQALADATRSGPIRAIVWNQQVKVVNKPEGLPIPPLPIAEIKWREDPQRVEEIRMNPAIHFVPITEQIETIETTHNECNQSGTPDSGVPHSPQPINEELAQINAFPLVLDTSDDNAREDSECSTSRESSPLSYEEQVKLRFRADVSALAGVPRDSPTRRVPSPPQAPAATETHPSGVALVINFQQEQERSFDKSVETFEKFLTRAPTVAAVEEDAVQERAGLLLRLLQERRCREQERLAESDEQETMRRYAGQPIVRMNSFEREQMRAELTRQRDEAERPQREAEREAREKKRRLDEMIERRNQEREAAEMQAIMDRRAAEHRERRMKEEKERREEEERLERARAALEEEKRRKREEEQRRADAIAAEQARRDELRRQRDEAERLRREEEERRVEAEERERERREEEERAEQERIEEERTEAERQRQQMARDERKALERKEKEEEERRKAEKEEEKRREIAEKRKELERKKFMEAATLEEKEKEAERFKSEQRRQQREEEKQQRAEEQKKKQAEALKRQEEEQARQALSLSEKFRLEEEERRKKQELLESAKNVIEEAQHVPSTPEAPKKITNSRRRGRKSQPNSRLQSTDSFEHNSNTRDHSRETNTSGYSGDTRESNETGSFGARPEEFQVSLKKATKKKAEDIKVYDIFKPKIHVETVPELNEEDRREAEKRKAFEERQAKEARKQQQAYEAREARTSRETREDSQRHAGRPKYSRRPVFSEEFLQMREAQQRTERRYRRIKDAVDTFFMYAAIFVVLVLAFCLIFGVPSWATFFPASATDTKPLPNTTTKTQEKAAPAEKPKEPEKPPPAAEKQSSAATSSDYDTFSTRNEMKCLFWAFKPPGGAAFCVRQPMLYYLAEYHDSTIVELADQEERSAEHHATVYDTCEYQTGLKFLHNIDGDSPYWFLGKWVDVNQTEYNETEAAVAYDMLTSDRMESCYAMFCHQPVGLVKNESYRELLSVLCYDFTRVLARLAHIVYAGWGEEVLMRTHNGAIPSPWFTLEYPYKSVNLDARNKYAIVKYEADDEYDLEIMRRTDVPLPLNPRRFSEKREHYYIESLFRNRSDPDTDWIVYKGVKVETVRFDEGKARQWAEVRDKYVKVKIDGSAIMDSSFDEDDCVAILDY